MTQYHLILTIALWDKDNYSFYRWGNWPSEGLNYLQSKQFEERILPYSSFHLKGLEHGRHSALLFQGFSKHGPWTSSSSIAWKLFRNANSQAPPQTSWLRHTQYRATYILTSSQGDWTKVCIVKAMVFPVVTYRCEGWTIKKAEHQRIDVFELWC